MSTGSRNGGGVVIKPELVSVSDVIFREDLYPRIKHDPSTVQKYAEDLDVLPPIEINQHKELIDGWHRWTAYKKNKIDQIPTTTTKTASDAELLELAIVRNATHGLQLSQEDKQTLARRIYGGTARRDQDATKVRLARILAVSERTMRNWLSRIDRDAKEAARRLAFERWLACDTQEEIAERVGWERRTISDWIDEFGDFGQLAESAKADANHVTNFQVPLYNVWKWNVKTEGGHFGYSEQTIVDNLLYLYTKPFDIVIDPFAGSGSTIDVCRRRFRRYWVSDRLPIIERVDDIRQHDLVNGMPPLPRWTDVKLVYLDPPYWKQAEGQYSSDPEDLANMPLERFTSTLASIICGFAKKLPAGAAIALLIQPTQWKAPDHTFTDHVADMLRMVKLPMDMRYACPFESQQATPPMVEWAQINRKCLVLSRELVVWRIP